MKHRKGYFILKTRAIQQFSAFVIEIAKSQGRDADHVFSILVEDMDKFINHSSLDSNMIVDGFVAINRVADGTFILSDPLNVIPLMRSSTKIIDFYKHINQY